MRLRRLLMPRFSIIVPHYDGAISDEMFIEGMDSIENSTFKDFEVLIYHDGPVNRPLPELSGYTFNYKFKETKTRYNDWGHSLRDLGIREAKGDYIIHFNPDNLLYPDALEELDNVSNTYKNLGKEFSIIICPIIMEGCQRACKKEDPLNKYYVYRNRDKKSRVILDGFPPSYGNIDCMQAVIKREVWLREGGWHDKSETSDATLYMAMCNKYEFGSCGYIIGVHR